MSDKTCRDCKFYRVIDFGDLFGCVQDPEAFETYRGTEKCNDFEPKVEEPEKPKNEPARYFHSWRKNTGAYSGAFTTHNGKTPASTSYDYEEYEPPKRPEPDGWYYLDLGQGYSVVREKRETKAYDHAGNSKGEWAQYKKVIARIPEIIWLDGREVPK